MQTLSLRHKFSFPSTAKQKADDFESVRLLLRLSHNRLPAKCEQDQYSELKADRKLQKWKVPYLAKVSSQGTCATGDKAPNKYLFIVSKNKHYRSYYMCHFIATNTGLVVILYFCKYP